MHLELNLNADLPSTILVAPGGYGKRYWLDYWTRQESNPILNAGFIEGFSDSYFSDLAHSCQVLKLPIPEQDRPRHWVRDLGATRLTICIDNWEELETSERIQRFWKEALLHRSSSSRLILASRKLPQLPIAQMIAAGGHFYGAEQLSWSEEECQRFWLSLGLTWNEHDSTFRNLAQGWPLAMRLHLQRRRGELDETNFQNLLSQALLSWLPPFIQNPNQLWQSEFQGRLKEWQCDSPNWLPLHQKSFEKTARTQPAYWLWLATNSEQSPARIRVLLERCLSLCQSGQHALKLGALTRMAHVASLQGDWALLDQSLALGEDLLDEAQNVDVAAWHYLSANRARQCCRYQDAHSALDALLELPARQPAVMNFQVRARILRGLTAYQQGNYELTRKAYSDALILAESDQNAQMQLEIKLMLAFLDALLGQTEEPLSVSLYSEVEALPLSAQPLVWLNLAFLQILGEHLDLRQGQAILQKVRQSATQLAWTSLEPMISDVEARLWRFHQDYDRAERLHQQAMLGLEPQTFDWLYASLNHALTLMRRKQLNEARPLLESICSQAQTSGTHGLLREAMAALQSIKPEQHPNLLQRPLAPVIVSRGDEPLLDIQCFGSFQLRLDGKTIERWPRKRARHLLLQLLLHPHGLHRETLADWLTGSDDLEQALRSLDVHIHALRKLLEPERKGKQASRYIRFHDAVYSFQWDCHYRWDAEAFLRCHQTWLRLRESNSSEAEVAVVAALELYTGPFLPELDFADEWLGERENYTRKAGDLVMWSLEYLSRLGSYEQAEDRAELLLKWDNLSEQGFSWLIKLAGQNKDRSRLERLGERMEQTYFKELGCPPPKELLQLYRTQLQSN